MCVWMCAPASVFETFFSKCLPPTVRLPETHEVSDPWRQQLTSLKTGGYHKIITPTVVVCIDVHSWGKGHSDPTKMSSQKE